jgi:cytochrome c oxidase assembly protein subunit 15
MLTAAIALLAIVAGPLPGFLPIHATLGIAALALACYKALTNKAARIAAALGAIECLVRNQTAAITIVHACLSPVFFAACVSIGLGGAGGQPGGQPAGGLATSGSGFRLLVKSAPALVLLQIILGAAYRHKAIGVMPHMAGAMLVAGLLLAICSIVLQRFPQPPPLRTAAGALLGIVLLQVSLGIAVFVMRLLDAETTPAFLPAVVAHVTVGSLTLAATTALAIRFDSTRTVSRGVS